VIIGDNAINSPINIPKTVKTAVIVAAKVGLSCIHCAICPINSAININNGCNANCKSNIACCIAIAGSTSNPDVNSFSSPKFSLVVERLSFIPKIASVTLVPFSSHKVPKIATPAWFCIVASSIFFIACATSCIAFLPSSPPAATALPHFCNCSPVVPSIFAVVSSTVCPNSDKTILPSFRPSNSTSIFQVPVSTPAAIIPCISSALYPARAS